MTLPFDITKIQNQLSLALTFINTYTRDTFPLFCSTKYLAPNAFHRVAGRDNYFDTQCGTSEAATILAVACLQASTALNSVTWRNLGLNFLNSFVNYFYYDNPYTTTISPNPRNTPFIRSHWLIVCYESVVSEGLQAGNDPFNFGYFGTLNFTNGVGNLPADTSKVYRVYTGELSYKNVYAPLKSGINYPINYYVRNGNRIFTNGNPSQPTSESNGTVVLASNVNGSFQIIYVRRDGSIINPPTNIRSGEGLVEPYPLIYACKASGREFSGFAADAAWWAYDAFKLAFQITGNNQYNNAAEVTKWNTIRYLVENSKESFFYKKEIATEPLRYPGSYLVQTNSSNNITISPSGYIATRETTGLLNQYLKLVVNAVSINQFPTMELQNYVTQVFFDYLVNIYVESAINTTSLIEVKLSLSTNANDFSQEWKAYWLLNGNGTSQNITFDYLAFFRPRVDTIWYTGIAQIPVYVYNTASWNYLQDNINGINTCITQVNITDSTGGAGLINFVPTSKIPDIIYSLSGNCRVRFKDSNNTFWYINLVATGNSYQTFSGTWQSIFNTSDKNITEIVFENTSNSVCNIKIFCVGASPEKLPVPCMIYKASVVCKLQSAYTWFIGDFKPINNSLDKLPYTPGSIGFTINTLNNVIQSFGRSQFYMAYQSPYSLSRWGFKEYARNVVKLLNDSQESYINQSTNRINGLLHQVFLPYDVENIPFLDRSQIIKRLLSAGIPFIFDRKVNFETDSYEFNKFSWKGLDPNTQWAPYCFRAMEDLARYYYENRNDSVARKILTNFINFIDKWNSENNNAAITNIIPNGDPQALYFEPHLKAIEGLTMLYCNISGLEVEITYRGIQNAFNYIDNQFVSTGNMSGCWCKNQPTFTSGSQQYQEFFSFWQGKIIEFYALLLKYQNLIIEPTDTTLPIFPLDFCNSPSHFIENIKESDYPIKYKNFRDGSNQRVILNNQPVGRIINLRYEKLDDSLTDTLLNFYENVNANFDGYFSFPSNYTYNDLVGKWIFVEAPKIKTFLGNSRKALFDITIQIMKS